MGPIPFSVGDVDSPLSGLTVRVTSSNQALVPDENLALYGVGTEQQIVVMPKANAVGTTAITITASDGTSSTTRNFVLNVLAIPR